MVSLRVITRNDSRQERSHDVSLRVITRCVMARASRRASAATKRRRNGIPFTVYLSEDMTAALNAISSQRKVDKSEVVRTAIQRLLTDIANGQLNLPLGI
jgi:hypothetical protein